MFSDNSEKESEQRQIAEWYAYQQEAVEAKFKEINTDALEEIRNKMRRKQTKMENEENIELIEKERSRIIESMKEHVGACEHPHCKEVKEIIMAYNFRPIDSMKEDEVSLIVKYGVCTGYVQTDCPVGSSINAKMMETHRIRKNM